MIILNRIKCNHCGDVITSFYSHDFKWCDCGKVAVDGGCSYLRRIGDDYTELSKDSDNCDFEEIRGNLRWGKNYDENMKKLPETQWIPLKDITEGHLEALIEQERGSEFFRIMFIREKQYRMLEMEGIYA